MGSWLSGLGSALLDVWYFEVSLVALLTFWLLDWLRVCLLDLSEQLGRAALSSLKVTGGGQEITHAVPFPPRATSKCSADSSCHPEQAASWLAIWRNPGEVRPAADKEMFFE